MAFDSTLSGTSATSMISVATADIHFEHHVSSDDWDTLTTTEKETFLNAASNRLNVLSFGGIKTDVSQTMKFPRKYLEKPDIDFLRHNAIERKLIFGDDADTRYYYLSTVIPDGLNKALCEMALHYIKKAAGDEPIVGEVDQEILNSLKLGPISSTIKGGLSVDRLPTVVKRYIIAIGPNAWSTGRQKQVIRG